MSITGTQPVTFTSPSSQAADYRIYGPLPAGEIVMSVRTPRAKNAIPFPYPPAVLNNAAQDPATFPFVYHDNGTISWPEARTSSAAQEVLRLNRYSLTPPFLFQSGTYTLSVRDYADASAPVLNLQVRPSDGSSMYTLDDSGTHSGVITFTLNKSCYLHAFLLFERNRTYAAATIYPQLEAGSMTEYEPVNPATLTTITLPRALEEGEYLSFSDQKIMPTGTPVTLLALQTLVGENVLMIENLPGYDNQISVTPGNAGINLIRFGDITPSEFKFKDTSIEKMYFGSSLLYQKSVPEQYVTLVPTDKFISEKASADDYRVYGPLPSGEIIISVRTPRVKNLLPYPYSGIEAGPGGDSWEPRAYYNYPDHSSLTITDHGDGTFEWVNQTTANYKSTIVFDDKRVLYPAGTYTMSVSPGATYTPQLGLRPYDADDNALGVYWDQNPGWRGTGYVTFTCSVPFYLRTDLYAANSYSYSGAYARPQLELGNTFTEYEPPNPATLTTITLPRALEENEYISYADQKIMPTGTPLVVPKLKTIIGENVIMIENYPRATNTITLTPATKE